MTADDGPPFGLTAEHEAVTSLLENLRALSDLDGSSVDRATAFAALVCLRAADEYLKSVLAGAAQAPEPARRARGVGDELVWALHDVNAEERERRRGVRAADGPAA